MTESQLATLIDNLRRFEGFTTWMYRDSAPAGNCTVGIGVMLPDVAAAQALPFLNLAANRPATANEVAQDFHRVMTTFPPAKAASIYKGWPAIELATEEVWDLAKRKLTGWAIPAAQHATPGLASLPWAAQQVLVDIQWNVKGGVAGFPDMLAACARGDWERAAVESHVSTSRPARNEWRAEMFRSC